MLAIPAAAAPAEPARAPEPPFLGRFMFRTYAQDEGMSDPSVECVLQDHVGFLWAGTDDGLFRFDGRGFTKFSRKQGLPQTRIYQLYETADGRLYAATAAGLARFQGHGFVVVGAPVLGAFAVSHQGIASDAAGTVYVGTDRGLFSGKDDRYLEDKEANAVGEGAVGGVHVDAAGALYFARGGLLFRKESGRVVEFGRPRGLPSEETIDEVRSDHDGRLWVRTVKHLYLLPKGGQRFERDDEGLPESSEVGRLAFDDRGALLVPTVQGLAFKQGGAWRLIGRREGLSSDAALSALVDREGSLWVGLLGGGLDRRLGRGEFTNWTRSDGLSQEVVWAIARQKSASGPGALWVGTEQGLEPAGSASRATSGASASRTASAATRSTTLAAGADGSVWIGSWPGGVDAPHAGRQAAALLGRGRGARTVPRGGDPRARRRRSLVRSRGGPLPAARRLEGAPCSSASRSAARSRTTCAAFAEDPAGTLYAASKQGILRLTGPSPRRFTRDDGLQRGLPVLDRVRLRRQRGRGLPRVDRRGAGDHRRRSDDGQADGRHERPDLEQGRPARTRRRGRALDRHRHRGRRVRPRLDPLRALRQAGGDGQRGPRPECVLSPKPTERSGSARAGA